MSSSSKSEREQAAFYVVGTPIGNLSEITFRALDVLRSVDEIFCEDTRRSRKLLEHFQIKKPLSSAPYFRERESAEKLLTKLKQGKRIAYVSDAGMPGLSDPGSILVDQVRKAGYKMEIVGGVSALTSFIAGLGAELESFIFVGFLPPKKTQKEKLFSEPKKHPIIFFESPHRLEKTLNLLAEKQPQRKMALAKELSKISEAFYFGEAARIKPQITSWKGEWVGLLWPNDADS